MFTRVFNVLAMVLLSLPLMIGCAGSDGLEEAHSFLDVTDSPGKADGPGSLGPRVAWDNGRHQVWPIQHHWTDMSPEAGIAWDENSGLNWDEKFARWVSSLEAIPTEEGSQRKTFTLTTPYGHALKAPVLECAEVAIFLRATFAAWYGLPFYMQASDKGKAIYIGHFGFLDADGNSFGGSPAFKTRYDDFSGTWQYGDPWPSDPSLARKGLYGGGDEMDFLPMVQGNPARAGAYFDSIFLNKRVGHFMMLALSWFGSMHLADGSNMFHVKAEAIRAGDVLLERWQRRGIGHTIPLMRVTDIGEGRIEVAVSSGSMPRRIPRWEDGPAAGRYFSMDVTGGPGINEENHSYASLGGGLRRWRVAMPRGDRYQNTFFPGDEAVWINSSDHEAIAERTEQFAQMMAELTPEEKKELALQLIESAREHLRQYPASCSARINREEAFNKLYALNEEFFWTDRATTDWHHRTLEDYVFAELTYGDSRTCCWNSSTSAMYEIIMSLNGNYIHDDQTNQCREPLVFMARDVSSDNDGYAQFREYAIRLGRGSEWVEWSEDESCPQSRETSTDTIAPTAQQAWCERSEPQADTTCGDTGQMPGGSVPLSGGTYRNLRICSGEQDHWSFLPTVSGRYAIKLALTEGTGDVDIQVFDSTLAELGSSRGTGEQEEVLVDLNAGDEIHLQVYVVGGQLERGYELRIQPL